MASSWPTSPDNLSALSVVPDEMTLSDAGTGSFNHYQHHTKASEAIDKVQLLAATLSHDHSNTEGRPTAKLAQANTHQSPDTDTSTTALHHTLGWGANQAARGSAVQEALGGISSSWNTLTDKPSTFPSTWTTVSGKPSTFPSTWDTVASKPSTFPPDAHTHSTLYWTQAQSDSRYAAKPGVGNPRAVSDVTGNNGMGLYWGGGRVIARVDVTDMPLATVGDVNTLIGMNASKVDAWGNTNTSQHAQGPNSTAYNNQAGNNRYAVWMDDGLNFGRATSSIKYKEDLEEWSPEVEEVLALAEGLKSFHRKADNSETREYGMIAEDVWKHVPEIVQYFKPEGSDEYEIDGIHYEMLGVVLLPVVKSLSDKIKSLEAKIETLESK